MGVTHHVLGLEEPSPVLQGEKGVTERSSQLEETSSLAGHAKPGPTASRGPPARTISDSSPTPSTDPLTLAKWLYLLRPNVPACTVGITAVPVFQGPCEVQMLHFWITQGALKLTHRGRSRAINISLKKWRSMHSLVWPPILLTEAFSPFTLIKILIHTHT